MKRKISFFSVTSALLSILTFGMYCALLAKVAILYIPWIVFSCASIVFPFFTKCLRCKSGAEGGIFEVLALILALYNFYWILATKTTLYSLLIIVICVCVFALYIKLFNVENSIVKRNLENKEDFGLVPENPVYTFIFKSVKGAEEYLNSIYTLDGRKISYHRKGSTRAEGINGMIDIYDTYLPSGEFYKTIYINMYGTRKSKNAPSGFSFSPPPSAMASAVHPRELKSLKFPNKKFLILLGIIVLALFTALLVIFCVLHDDGTKQNDTHPTKTITVALILDFYPYEYAADGEYVGVHIDLAKELATRNNWNVIFVVSDFQNIIQDVSNGTYDLAFGIAKTPEREAVVSFTDSYHYDGFIMHAIYYSENFSEWSNYNATFKNMISDGTVAEILKKYNL